MSEVSQRNRTATNNEFPSYRAQIPAQFGRDSQLLRDSQRPDRKTTFARRLGFSCYKDLLSQSTEIQTVDGKHWHLSSVGNEWLLWNDEQV